jgi:predicted PurR-regulated permease PerM
LDKTKLKYHLLLITYGIVLYLVLRNISAVADALSFLRSVLASCIIGLVLAYLVNIPYSWFRSTVFAFMTRKGRKLAKFNKALSFILSYIIVSLGIVVLFWLVIPQLINSLTILVQNIGFYVSEIERFLNQLGQQFGQENLYQEQLQKIMGSMEDKLDVWINDLINNSLNIIGTISSQVSKWVIGIVFSVYLLYSKELLLQQIKKFLKAFFSKKQIDRISELSERANRIFSGFISGNLISAMIVGILCFIGTMILQTPSPLMISVIIGVTNIIPIVGPFIGGIPSTLFILLEDPLKALIFVILIIAIQQVESNIVVPRLFGNFVGLPSVWVLLAIIVGGGLFGVIGMVFAVPVFALFYSIICELIQKRLDMRKHAPAPDDT